MATTYMTPGVYIEEKNAFANSAVAVPTAVPVFIGYTEKAERFGKSLLYQPVRISSFAEYVEIFGSRFKPKFTIAAVTETPTKESFFLNNIQYKLQLKANNTSYFFDSIRLFYANGGSDCYILSVGNYGGSDKLEIKIEDFFGGDPTKDVFEILVKEYEPTLVVIPDIIALGDAAYPLYQQVLQHCSEVQSRFGIFDIANRKSTETTDDVITKFRFDIGMNSLNYGAAYFPWLKTSVVPLSELDFENLDDSVALDRILPEPNLTKLISDSKASIKKLDDDLKNLVDTDDNAKKALETQLLAFKTDSGNVDNSEQKKKLDEDNTKLTELDNGLKPKVDTADTKKKELADLQKTTKADDVEGQKKITDLNTEIENLQREIDPIVTSRVALVKEIEPIQFSLLPVAEKKKQIEFKLLPLPERRKKLGADLYQLKKNFHQSLKASSETYANILEACRAKMNELPPSGAMAGIYALTDSSRGVWKAPANVSVGMVQAPMINVSHDEQQKLNVDVMSGKSVNVIRAFPGIGTLVWGARTLDGNSNDWKYINVRRTLIMLEQSLKLATRTYVFEANNANTWVTVSSMINNFLYNIWRQGAFFGATPEEAYNVQIGLNTTMTPNDILEGIMRISVKVAIVRPAEFIVITFQQQQQQS